MSEKILSIDIGASALKAVLLSQSIRAGFKVEMAETIAITDDGGEAAVLAALAEKVNYRQVRVNINLPAEKVSFHHIKLPFRDAKKIQQTIAYELETLLPQGIEESLFDYNIITQSNQSDILAAVVPTAAVLERRALFGEKLPTIGIVGVGALAVASLLIADKAAASRMLLDIGARQTTAVFIQGDRIVQARSYAFGGEMSPESGSDTCATDTDPVANSLVAARLRFMQEVANTLEYLQWGGYMAAGMERILLTGGGALSEGIKEDLARYFSLPVEMVDVAALGGVHLPEPVRKNWQPVIMNQVLALAIERYSKGRGFNFAIQELERQAKRGELLRMAKWSAGVLAISGLFLVADAYLGYRYDKIHLDNLKKEIKSVFRGAAPEVTRIVDPVQQFKVKIAEMKKISAGVGGAGNSATVLDVLRDISALAPPATEFLMSSFSLDDSRLVIKGTVKNFDAVDALKKELTKSKYLSDLQIGTTSLLKKEDKVEFDLRMTVKR